MIFSPLDFWLLSLTGFDNVSTVNEPTNGCNDSFNDVSRHSCIGYDEVTIVQDHTRRQIIPFTHVGLT